MSEGPVAGALQVPVESDTAGFAQELKKKIEAAAEGLDVAIGVQVERSVKARARLTREIKSVVQEATAGVRAQVAVDVNGTALRATLEKTVKEAAAGVRASIGVDVDEDALRAKLEAAVKSAGSKVRVALEVDGSLQRQVTERTTAAQVQARRSPVEVLVQAKDRLTEGVAAAVAKAKAFAASAKARVQVPVTADGEGLGGIGKFGAGGLLGALQGGGGAGGIAKGATRVARVLSLVLGVLSLVQPAVATVVGSLGSLVAVLGVVGNAVGVLAGAPGIILALVSVLGAGIIAFKGFTGATEGMVAPMRRAAVVVRSFAGDWQELMDRVQTGFWVSAEDDLRPTIEVFLPMLSDGLTKVSENLGLFFKGLFTYVRSAEFAQDFPSSMEAAAELTGGFGDALQGVIEWFFAATEAARPFLRRVSEGATAFGDWTRGLLDTRQERNEFSAFLLNAADSLSLVSSVLVGAWESLRGIFAAGMPSGERILMDWDESLEDFATWVNSPRGGQAVKDWFDAVEPTARAAGEALQAIGSGLLDMAVDPNTAALLEQITTEAFPAIGDLLRTLGEELGPSVIEFLTAVVDFANGLSSSGGGLAFALDAITGFLNSLNAFLDDNPGAADVIGKIAGSLLLLKAAGVGLKALGIPKIVGGVAGGLGALNGLLRGRGLSSSSTTTAGGAKGAGMRVYWTNALPVWMAQPGTPSGVGADGKGKKGGKHGSGKTKTGPGGGVGKRVTPKAGGFKGVSAGKLGVGAGALLLLSGLLGGDGVDGEQTAGFGGGGGLALAGGAGLLGYGAYDLLKKKQGGPLLPLSKGAAGKGGGLAGLAGKAGQAAVGKGGIAGLLGKAGKGIVGVGGKALRAGGPVGLIASIGGGLLGGAIQDGTGKNNARNALGGTLAGAAGGAGTGALIGSIIPGIGTAAGAVVGGAIGGAKGYIDGTGGMDAFTKRLKSWGSDVSTKVSEIAGTVGTKAKEIGGTLATNFANTVQTTKQKFGEVKDGVVGGLSGAKDAVTRKAGEIGTSLRGKWDEVRTGATTKWTEISGAVTGKAGDLRDGVVRTAGEVAVGAASKWTSFRDDATTKFEAARSTVVGKVGALRDGVVGGAETLRSSVATKLTAFRDDAGTKFETARKTVVGKAGDLAVGAVAKVEGLRTGAADKLTSLRDDAGTKLESARKTVVTKAGDLASGATSKVESLRTDAAEKLTSLRDDAGAKFESARSTVAEKAESIRSNAASKVEETRKSWSGKLGELRDNTGSRLEEARTKAAEKVESIRSSIAGKAEEARAGWNTKVAELRDNTRDRLEETKTKVAEKLGNLKTAFETGRDRLGEAWSAVGEKIKSPVRSLVDPVYSTIRKAFNAVGGLVGKSIPAVANFATGGVLGGYTPGRDVHSFTSPTGGRLNLSGGEAIMRPEWTRGVGRGFVDTMNAIASSRGVKGVRAAMGALANGTQNFASGGVAALLSFGRELRTKGYQVGENRALGDNPRPGAHSATGWHYKANNSGAIDVNAGAGESTAEKRRLVPAVLEAIRRGFGAQFLAAGHYNHAHFDAGTYRSVGNMSRYGGPNTSYSAASGGGAGGGGFLDVMPLLRKVADAKNVFTRLSGSDWASKWLGGGMKSLYDGAKTKVVDWVKDLIPDGLEGAVGTVKKTGSAVAGWIKDLVPGLAHGATVQPTRGGTLARIAEAGRAETIVDEGLVNRRLADLESVRELLEQVTRGGGTSINVHPQPRQSEEEIGRAAAARLQWERSY